MRIILKETMFKVGDKVSVLDDTIVGTVIRTNARKSVIEDEDGFERIYLNSNLVIYKTSVDYKLTDEETEKHILSKINASISKGKVALSSKVTQTNYNQNVLEIDLHIEELVDDHSYMSNFDILQRQMQTCRMFIEKAMRLNAKKAILIHGKGEGVLKHEIHSYLDRLENAKHMRIEYFEAPYVEYGVGGATEVRFL